jgi:hypothetical protein
VTAYGGDALYMCDAGIIPLSGFRSGKPTDYVVEKHALTGAIGRTWRSTVNERRSDDGWGLAALTRYSLAAANVPWGASDAQQVVVSDGGAVSRWGGIPAAVWAEGMGGRVFCGDATAGGRVLLWGETTTDDGDGVRAEAVTAYTSMRGTGRTKRALRVQPIISDHLGVTTDVRVLTDYVVPTAQMDALGAGAAAPALPAISGGSSYLVWDSSDWDEALWAGETNDVSVRWRTASAVGQAFAVRLATVSGTGRPAWLDCNLIYDVGGPVG